MSKIKVLLADNHTVAREGLRSLLENEPDIGTIYETGDNTGMFEQVKSKTPDVVVMDLSMSNGPGIDAIRMIRETSKKCKIVILTMNQKRSLIREVLNAGVSGYLLKTNSVTDVLTAIRAVHGNKYYLSPEVNADIIDSYLKKESIEPLANRYDLLTRREQHVFRLMAEGNTTTEIAGLLTISPKTVAKHRTNLMEKLEMKNTATLVRYAIQIGVVEG